MYWRQSLRSTSPMCNKSQCAVSSSSSTAKLCTIRSCLAVRHTQSNSSAIADAAVDLAELNGATCFWSLQSNIYSMEPFLQIFVISSQKIRQKEYETLYKYTTRNPKAAVSRYVSSVPLQWQVCDSAVPSFLSFC